MINTLNALIIIIVALWAPLAFSSPVIVYGEDNRMDTFQSTSSLFKNLASSTAAMIEKGRIKVRGNTAELIGDPLGEVFKLCGKERFYHQPFVANCSGFLVAPDIIVTAGHCFEHGGMCNGYDWVFDYKVDDENQRSVSVPKENLYKCKKVLEQKLTKDLDFAIIRLDRPVTGRKPVKIANVIKVGTPVVMIGHPSGLPQKVTDNAKIKSVSATEFKANLDAFQINSGSAVFNASNGELLGILVRGVVDYRTNRQYQCTEVNVTSDDAAGEDIASYTQFLDLLIKHL